MASLEPDRPRSIMLAALLTTVLFSISAVSGSRSSRLLGGTEAHFWRMLLAASLLALYAHSFGQALESQALGLFLVSGCIGFGIGDVALFQALPRLGSRLSILMVTCFSSPLAALLEWVWLGTALTVFEIVWAAIILTGVSVALLPKENPHLAPGRLGAGIAAGLIAAFCQGFGAVLSRKAFEVAAVAGESIDGITAAYQRTLGGILVTALCLLIVKRRHVYRKFTGAWRDTGMERRDKASLWRAAWPWVLVNGVSGPALGVSCFQWALKTTPTGIVLPIVALTPVVIIPFTRYWEGERPTARSLAGVVVAVAGAVALAVAAGHR